MSHIKYKADNGSIAKWAENYHFVVLLWWDCIPYQITGSYNYAIIISIFYYIDKHPIYFKDILIY